MSRPKVGETFQKRYLILAELGAGGMGAVYRARQLDAGREVALKFLKAEEKYDDETIKRFFREFKLLSSLSHPNIVTIYGMALDADSVPFAVCEFLEGTNLKKVLANEKHLSWQRTVKIALQICNAMQYVHESGIVHRDLKPENVMLLDRPEPDFVKVVDFGLSRIFFDNYEESKKITVTGQLVGTANYMSPELISQKADARSDIYSLGCIMFEMLAGEFLFEADTAVGVIYKHCNENPRPRFFSIKSAVPKKLIDVLTKSLVKDPEQRYASMKDLAADLNELSENPVELQPVKHSGTLYSRENRWGTLFCAMAVLLGLGLGLVLLQMKKQPGAEKPPVITSSRLPKKAAGVLNIIGKTENFKERRRLAEEWLDKHATASGDEQILVLEELFKTDMCLNDREAAGSVLRKIQQLLPQLDDRVYEQATIKNRMYFNMAVLNSAAGNGSFAKDFAARGLRTFLQMDGERPMEETQANLRVLLVWGDYTQGLELAQKYFDKLKAYLGNDRLLESRFLMNLGDLQICAAKTADAKQTYEMSVELASLIEEKKYRIYRLTGVKLAERRSLGVGRDVGLPFLSLGERLAYLDNVRGRELFIEGCRLLEEEEELRSSAAGSTAASRAFRTERFKPFVWLNFSEIGSELGCADSAESCASMARKSVDTVRELDQQAQFEFLSQKTFAKRLLENGKRSECKQQLPKALLALERLPSESRVRFYAELSELASQNNERVFSEELFAKATKLQSELKLKDTQTLVALARAAEALSKTGHARGLWNEACRSSDGFPSFDDLIAISYRLGNLPTEPVNILRVGTVPHVGSVFLVDGLLKYGRAAEAEKVISAAIKNPDQRLGRSLCLYELGKFYAAHGRIREAKAKLEEAHNLFVSCAKDGEYI